MKPKELSEALGEIDQSYITEAAAYHRHRLDWLPWVAACATVFMLLPAILGSGSAGIFIDTIAPTSPAEDYYSDGIPLSQPLVTHGDGLVTECVSVELDVQEFPGGFHNLESYLDFQSTATMEFTFRNPTTEPLTVQLTLPCGKDPMYALRKDYDTDTVYYHAARERYRFYLNDQPIPAVFRVTGSEVPPVAEGNWHTWHITESTTVTKYTCRVTELEACDDPHAAIWGPGAYSDVIGILDRNGNYETINGNSRTWLSTALGSELVVYIIGDAPDYHLGWHFLSGYRDQTPIQGTAELVDTQVMTFLEFADQSWQADYGISRSDWAYALASTLDKQIFNSKVTVDFSYYHWNPYRWYEYELTIAPGETAVHRVSLPLYPSLLLGGGNTECVYTLNLATLEKLGVTGSQSLILSTPLPMTESSVEFAAKDDRYSLDLGAVGGTELTFTLAQQRTLQESRNHDPLWIYGILGGAVGFLLWYLIRRKKDTVC